ncbi:MAG TPA: ATP synthase subunit I [Chitinophagaceae bacterium]|nr:ATP synthase subunit I [Chitinophagaceae bacterium]
MADIIYLAVALLAGAIIGVIFFGGLWLTTKKAVTSRLPAVWVLGSFFLRIFIALTGFYIVSQGNWHRLVICMVGFLAARFFSIRYVKLTSAESLKIIQEEKS